MVIAEKRRWRTVPVPAEGAVAAQGQGCAHSDKGPAVSNSHNYTDLCASSDPKGPVGMKAHGTVSPDPYLLSGMYLKCPFTSGKGESGGMEVEECREQISRREGHRSGTRSNHLECNLKQQHP